MNKKTALPNASSTPKTNRVKHWLFPLYSTNYENKITELPLSQLRKLGLIYSIYRIIVSLFLFLTNYSVFLEPDTLFVEFPSFLQWSVLSIYSVASLLLFILYYLVKRYPQRQLSIGLILDVVILSLLLYTNGAPDLQLTMLYMVVVAACFMLLPPYQGVFITLLAIIFVIYQQFFYALINDVSINKVGDALLLSFSFIGVAFISWTISQRLAQVEQIAAAHAQELKKLNAINKEVINKMNNGVMVIDNKLNVVISNESAIKLLAIEMRANAQQQTTLETKQSNHISMISNTLIPLESERERNQLIAQTLIAEHPEMIEWFKSASKFTQSHFIYQLPHTYATEKLRLNTTPLQDGSLLIIIEDLSREQSNAQQLKLASLGQLTASIAHEIRNPLSTISQASQFLIEDDTASDENTDDNHELYRMIYNQTKRVNRIIEDVLKLSRQAKPQQTKIELVSWLTKFIEDHFNNHDVFIQTNCHPYIYFDAHQLEQVLINLINNGLRFSSKSHPHAFVELVVECAYNNVILDILDNGMGVDTKNLDNLFHPFFTTDNEGTGLGLYLSQAFSEANHARLTYVPEHQKTCFRLLIPQVAS